MMFLFVKFSNASAAGDEKVVVEIVMELSVGAISSLLKGLTNVSLTSYSS